MARGRPPLDPEIKLQRRREALQRYNEKYLFLLILFSVHEF